MPVYIPLLFMAFPVVFLAGWVVIFSRHRRVARANDTVPAGWVRAVGPGVVTSEERFWVYSGGPEGGSTWVRRPVVTYRPASGGEVTFRSPAYGTFMPKPGAAVNVVHDPVDPTRAKLAPESVPRTFRRLSTAVFVIGLVLFLPLAAVFELLGWFMLTHR